MGKYVCRLLDQSLEQFPGVEFLGLSDRPDLPFQSNHPNLVAKPFEMRGHRFRLWEQLALPRKAQKQSVDILHCTATTMPWWQPVPTVVTIHDTLMWGGDECDAPRWYLNRLIPSAYSKSAAIITISECSRNDILSAWPKLESKIHVIPHGVDGIYLKSHANPLPAPLLDMGVRPPYFLYVGGAVKRKRLDWAIKVFQAIQADVDTQLVVCGLDTANQQSLPARVPEHCRHRVIATGFILEELMPALFSNCVALLYPTLYEGFGLPALEAQAVGTPAIFSKVGSLQELCGPGAITPPSEDLNAWVDACEKCLKMRRVQTKPNKESQAWARQFSWSESCKRHIAVYSQVAERSAF